MIVCLLTLQGVPPPCPCPDDAETQPIDIVAATPPPEPIVRTPSGLDVDTKRAMFHGESKTKVLGEFEVPRSLEISTATPSNALHPSTTSSPSPVSVVVGAKPRCAGDNGPDLNACLMPPSSTKPADEEEPADEEAPQEACQQVTSSIDALHMPT